MQRITVHSYVDGCSSYGFLGEQVTQALSEQGWFPSINPIQLNEDADVMPLTHQSIVRRCHPSEPNIICHTPDIQNWCEDPIHFTMWEASRLKQNQVENLNKAKAVIVPSKWNSETFSAAGVESPIHVVPLGINTRIFNYRPRHRRSVLTFGAAGKLHGIWNSDGTFKSYDNRKNFDAIELAFAEAFPTGNEPVELKVKVFPNQINREPEDSRISLIQKHLSQREVLNFYNSIDCFVSASRGEGWGWMQQESMACGRPVIAPIFGGLREFMTPENSFSVDYGYSKPDMFYEGCGLWAEPDIEHIAHHMRSIYENPSLLDQKAPLASASAMAYDWTRFSLRLDEVVSGVINDG